MHAWLEFSVFAHSLRLTESVAKASFFPLGSLSAYFLGRGATGILRALSQKLVPHSESCQSVCYRLESPGEGEGAASSRLVAGGKELPA